GLGRRGASLGVGARVDHRGAAGPSGCRVRGLRRGYPLRADPLALAERRGVLALACRTERADAPGDSVWDRGGSAATPRPEARGGLAAEQSEHFGVARELVLLDARLGCPVALRLLDPENLRIGDVGRPSLGELVESGGDYALGLRGGALGDGRDASEDSLDARFRVESRPADHAVAGPPGPADHVDAGDRPLRLWIPDLVGRARILARVRRRQL